jgi:hypothetical protein
MRRRLLALLIAGLLLMAGGWLASIQYFSDVTGDYGAIRIESTAALDQIVTAREQKQMDAATFRGAVVRVHELTPLLNNLKAAKDDRVAHRWSIGAAIRYDEARKRVVHAFKQLINFRDAIPTTRPR